MKTMNRWKGAKALVVCAAVGLAVAGAKPVQADLITFTDRAAFEAAVGSFTTENFNSITSDTSFRNSTLAFPDLTLRSTGGARFDILVDVPPYGSGMGSITSDVSSRVNFRGLNPTSVVSILFDSPMWAVGFDTINYDVDGESAQAFVGSTLIGDFPQVRNTVGFIGVLDTSGASINSIDIFDPLATLATGTYNAFDNVSYSAAAPVATAATPEPGTWAMMGIGLCGVVLMGRKKKLGAGKSLA